MKRVFEKSFFVALAFGLIFGAGVSGALALECPEPQALGDGSTPLPEVSSQLSAQDALTLVPGLVASLRKQFPHADPARLANFLIAAYCPVLKADSSLSEEAKQTRIREFADQVVAKAYSR